MNPIERLAAFLTERRARRRERAYYGDCHACTHDWREHMPPEGCGECQYEIEHEEPNAPLAPCLKDDPGYTF